MAVPIAGKELHLIFMHVGILPACASVCVCVCLHRHLEPQGLELQMLVIHHVSARSSGRSVCSPNHWVIYPALRN